MFSLMTCIFIVCLHIPCLSIFYKEYVLTYVDHIVHHVLSIYALGASPEEIKAAYRRNSSYQRPVLPTKIDVVESLSDKGGFKAALGKEDNYPNFLAFFQTEIEAKGVGAVLNEYLFAGDDVAESMLARLFGGECYFGSNSCF